jgi:hypothetical protein
MLDLRGILSFSGYVIHLFCLVAVLFAREGYPLALSVLALIVTVTLTTKGCNKMAKDYSRVAFSNQHMQDATFGNHGYLTKIQFEQAAP